MFHKQRWTLEKIRQRLELIAPLVHSERKPLPSFRYHELETARTLPPIGSEFDDSTWQEIEAYQYWGSWMQNFVLRTTFVIPEDWDKSRPIGLYLPLGEAGDFSHPEALEAIANQLGAERRYSSSTRPRFRNRAWSLSRANDPMALVSSAPGSSSKPPGKRICSRKPNRLCAWKATPSTWI